MSLRAWSLVFEAAAYPHQALRATFSRSLAGEGWGEGKPQTSNVCGLLRRLRRRFVAAERREGEDEGAGRAKRDRGAHGQRRLGEEQARQGDHHAARRHLQHAAERRSETCKRAVMFKRKNHGRPHDEAETGKEAEEKGDENRETVHPGRCQGEKDQGEERIER